ncbi:hypothetical protein PPTG_21102 [Phytophthora nicotianae INRA-310]|uniref:Uncharacterized protein n=1 Tax=Phytophthora nicotianae (strain INRA-310) TaxID=761204 RepID=W2R861_PHYN3|nr:hypothetical protein PPTG_21102 [Phytophthora nicotianae INRA-310]ETN21587.1 hypothetical protein PPTG_21102 [Phytophthora nicotianae INRA-310]
MSLELQSADPTIVNVRVLDAQSAVAVGGCQPQEDTDVVWSIYGGCCPNHTSTFK